MTLLLVLWAGVATAIAFAAHREAGRLAKRCEAERSYGRAEALVAFSRIAKGHGFNVGVHVKGSPPPSLDGYELVLEAKMARAGRQVR